MKKRLQRICSCVLLCAALLCAALPAPAAAASTGFSDVPATHWAADSIRRAVDLGLFQGQTATRFGLGAPMTRGAFVTALCRLFGWEMVTPETGSYADNQDKTAWYYSAVETAYANGAITRQTDTFRPRDPITREELAVMLVRAMGYGTIAGLAQDLPIPFRDVDTDDWFYDAVAYVYENGIMAGTDETIFEPTMELDRAMAAQLFYNLEGKPAVTGDSTFTDVTSGHWAVDAITWAAQNDIVVGIGGNLYDPDSNVTREQLAVILYNFAKRQNMDVAAGGGLSAFADAASVSDWAEEAMIWAVGKGLISGKEGSILDPAGSATRAEVATILMRFCEIVAK